MLIQGQPFRLQVLFAVHSCPRSFLSSSGHGMAHALKFITLSLYDFFRLYIRRTQRWVLKRTATSESTIVGSVAGYTIWTIHAVI
jgi:hypothetical protein